jgi:hypothetical protein
MQQGLQQASHNTYNGCLQALMLSTLLLLQKLHVKIAHNGHSNFSFTDESKLTFPKFGCT